MKRFPIVLARHFEYCGIRPEENWWLALYCVNVGPASVDDLVRHDGIHCFAVNWPRMQKRWKANSKRQENYSKPGKAKFARPMSWHTHHSADYFPDVVRLRESSTPRVSSLKTSSTVIACMQRLLRQTDCRL